MNCLCIEGKTNIEGKCWACYECGDYYTEEEKNQRRLQESIDRIIKIEKKRVIKIERRLQESIDRCEELYKKYKEKKRQEKRLESNMKKMGKSIMRMIDNEEMNILDMVKYIKKNQFKKK